MPAGTIVRFHASDNAREIRRMQEGRERFLARGRVNICLFMVQVVFDARAFLQGRDAIGRDADLSIEVLQ